MYYNFYLLLASFKRNTKEQKQKIRLKILCFIKTATIIIPFVDEERSEEKKNELRKMEN